MKNITLSLCCMLCISLARADEVEAENLVLSYSSDQRKFDWNAITSGNRSQVIDLLKEIRAEKKSTVLGGYGIGPWTAERMLLGLGDEVTIREAVDLYHARKPGHTNITDLVELGQAMAIPYLAEDLISDKYHYFEQRTTDGRVERLMDGDKAYNTARNIVSISSNSRQFPETIRASAKALRRQFSYKHKEIIIRRLTDWWRQNERWLLAQQFDKVTLLPALEIVAPTVQLMPAAQPAPGPMVPTVESPPKSDESGKNVPISVAASRWSWLAGGE